MPKDFFGNEIEVGDEVAYLHYSSVYVGDVSAITDGGDIFVGKRYIGTWDGSILDIFVNTEKKHREKALDYLAAEAQEWGMYDEGVGITPAKEGFE